MNFYLFIIFSLSASTAYVLPTHDAADKHIIASRSASHTAAHPQRPSYTNNDFQMLPFVHSLFGEQGRMKRSPGFFDYLQFAAYYPSSAISSTINEVEQVVKESAHMVDEAAHSITHSVEGSIESLANKLKTEGDMLVQLAAVFPTTIEEWVAQLGTGTIKQVQETIGKVQQVVVATTRDVQGVTKSLASAAVEDIGKLGTTVVEGTSRMLQLTTAGGDLVAKCQQMVREAWKEGVVKSVESFLRGLHLAAKMLEEAIIPVLRNLQRQMLIGPNYLQNKP